MYVCKTQTKDFTNDTLLINPSLSYTYQVWKLAFMTSWFILISDPYFKGINLAESAQITSWPSCLIDPQLHLFIGKFFSGWIKRKIAQILREPNSQSMDSHWAHQLRMYFSFSIFEQFCITISNFCCFYLGSMFGNKKSIVKGFVYIYEPFCPKKSLKTHLFVQYFG